MENCRNKCDQVNVCIHLADALRPGGLLPELGVQQVAGPHLCVHTDT